MSLNAVKILGINITISSKKEVLEEIKKRLDSTEKSRSKVVIIVTPNPEQIVRARRDKRFAAILSRADVALPDGIGVVWAHRILGGNAPIQRIPGVEFMEDLVGQAYKRVDPVALIGGRGDLAVKTFECLSRKYPGLKGWGMAAPEIKLDELGKLEEFVQFIFEKIQATGVKIVFVGLGAPKQELFIEQLVHRLELIIHSKSRQTSMNHKRITVNPIILMSVGGSFDIITGRMPRAPQIMRMFGLEWLWRLGCEPWRWQRQVALVKFAWLVFQKRYTTK